MLKQKVENVEKHQDTVEEKVQEVCDHQQDTDYIQDKLMVLEDRSCRNDLQIDGLIGKRRDVTYICEDKVKQIFRKNLGIEKNIDIDRVHRVSAKNGKKNKENKNNKKPKTIVLRLTNYKDKNLKVQSCKLKKH